MVDGQFCVSFVQEMRVGKLLYMQVFLKTSALKSVFSCNDLSFSFWR